MWNPSFFFFNEKKVNIEVLAKGHVTLAFLTRLYVQQPVHTFSFYIRRIYYKDWQKFRFLSKRVQMFCIAKDEPGPCFGPYEKTLKLRITFVKQVATSSSTIFSFTQWHTHTHTHILLDLFLSKFPHFFISYNTL